ncbi:MAG: hypothetical protein JKX98_08600 [Alcanivoracaceae bacterium]|nr:hypothetical protein [Alcanivoracaceae bacterium]
MNEQTLHLCNVNEITDINNYCKLVSSNDAIIFYGDAISIKRHQSILAHVDNINFHFLVSNDVYNISTISYDDWVELVDKYQKTYAWK